MRLVSLLFLFFHFVLSTHNHDFNSGFKPATDMPMIVEDTVPLFAFRPFGLIRRTGRSIMLSMLSKKDTFPLSEYSSFRSFALPKDIDLSNPVVSVLRRMQTFAMPHSSSSTFLPKFRELSKSLHDNASILVEKHVSFVVNHFYHNTPTGVFFYIARPAFIDKITNLHAAGRRASKSIDDIVINMYSYEHYVMELHLENFIEHPFLNLPPDVWKHLFKNFASLEKNHALVLAIIKASEFYISELETVFINGIATSAVNFDWADVTECLLVELSKRESFRESLHTIFISSISSDALETFKYLSSKYEHSDLYNNETEDFRPAVVKLAIECHASKLTSYLRDSDRELFDLQLFEKWGYSVAKYKAFIKQCPRHSEFYTYMESFITDEYIKELRRFSRRR